MASQDRICLKDSPPAGHVAGFKTSFAFLYYLTPQSDIHKLPSTCSVQHIIIQTDFKGCRIHSMDFYLDLDVFGAVPVRKKI